MCVYVILICVIIYINANETSRLPCTSSCRFFCSERCCSSHRRRHRPRYSPRGQSTHSLSRKVHTIYVWIISVNTVRTCLLQLLARVRASPVVSFLVYVAV